MNGSCCMTNSNGQEYPGAPRHDSDCPVGGERAEWGGSMSAGHHESYYDRNEPIGEYAERARNIEQPQFAKTDHGPRHARDTHREEERFPTLRDGPVMELIRQLDWPVDDNWLISIATFSSRGLKSASMGWLVGVAQSRVDVPKEDRWKFFCGCCWKMIREAGR